MKDNNKLYQQKAEAELREITAKIEQLKAKADQAGSDARLELNKRLESLKTDKDRMKARLAEMKNASAEAWVDLKAVVDRAISDLKTAINAAVERF